MHALFYRHPSLDTLAEDKLVKTINSKILAEKLHSEYQVVQDAGHGLLTEKPEEVNSILKSFLERASQQLLQGQQLALHPTTTSW
jgi:pimeloyl-ACP methyl ester carboxylesterase